jgi:hypothetical protein
MVESVKMLCIDGPIAGQHLDVPYPCNAIYLEPAVIDYDIILEMRIRSPERRFLYHCHRFRIISLTVIIGSLDPGEPSVDAVVRYMLTDAAREAIAR